MPNARVRDDRFFMDADPASSVHTNGTGLCVIHVNIQGQINMLDVTMLRKNLPEVVARLKTRNFDFPVEAFTEEEGG